MVNRLFFLVFFLVYTSIVWSDDTDNSHNKALDTEEEVKPPQIGNFSLPASQQPSTLFGFGGNIIDPGQIQLSVFADDFVGRRRVTQDILPNVVYGINSTVSIGLFCPFTPELKDRCNKSHGLEDFYIQGEYAFYNKATSCYIDQATVLASVTMPTGSSRKIPSTGLGSLGIFLGGTFYRMMVDWFFFGAPGVLLPTSYHHTKFGEQFLYQLGAGRSFPSPEGWIYAWMIEIDGQYGRRNKLKGRLDPNSGGNTFWATPSIWISNKYFTFQFGVSLPVVQSLNGNQRKFDYALLLNLAWSFYDLYTERDSKFGIWRAPNAKF